MVRDNHLGNVIAGNEKVLERALADAKFFYDEDRKQSLEDNLEKFAGCCIPRRPRNSV